MVIIKTPEQVDGIRRSCRLLARIMNEVKAAVKPGVTTRELNVLTERLIAEAGAKPAFKGYQPAPGMRPFPSAVCTSVNNQVVHGMAVSDEPLKEGDIIGLDMGVVLDGYYSDMAVTMPVGVIKPEVQTLLDVTRQSLINGIAAIRPGAIVRDISSAIESTIKPHGYGIVRDFVGHGVGLQVHEDPPIPNYVDRRWPEGMNLVLREGMVLAIEPMVNLGKAGVAVLDDDWTVVTEDGSLSAHFEHTIAVTKTGHEILTVTE
jgi:methionyl aminopeptidase